jgi:uncharacterized protein (TIGR04255 family)
VGAKTKRYKNAPITEAVIEIRVHPQESFKREALSALAESLKGEFPKQLSMRQLQMGLAVSAQPEDPVNMSSSQQLRRDGLAFSHMAPYSEWPTFRSEARPLWERFRAVVPDAKLTRCGLRYINRVDIPEATIELNDYFRLYPEVPKQLPCQDVVAMVTSLLMPQGDLECMAVINQSLVEPGKPDHVSVVLDIDLFRQGIEQWTDSEVWDFFDKLRDRKNDIFEGCITDRTRELIDQ